VLIACEFSGVVRRAFERQGHDVISCDLLPALDGAKNHYQGDVRELLKIQTFDLMIAHPPCTYLAHSGVQHLKDRGPWAVNPVRMEKMNLAEKFFNELLRAPVKRICVENPVMHGLARTTIRKEDQKIQPWEYGHGEVKGTCLWLKGLPKLVPTEIVAGREPRCHMMGTKNRKILRSITYPGIAEAMAVQWTAAVAEKYQAAPERSEAFNQGVINNNNHQQQQDKKVAGRAAC